MIYLRNRLTVSRDQIYYEWEAQVPYDLHKLTKNIGLRDGDIHFKCLTQFVNTDEHKFAVE